jgi:hypothetical protein
MTDDDEGIREVVTRLARRDPSGGAVIERAAILAEGAASEAILAWIAAHDGQPEAPVPASEARGLHGGRLNGRERPQAGAPRRYVLPPGALS